MIPFVHTIGTRATALLAVLALAIQPCIACLDGGYGAAFAAPEMAAPGHSTSDHDGGCETTAGRAAGGDHAAAPESASACPTLSARGPADATAPASAAPALGAPVAPPAITPAATSVASEPAASHGAPADPVPLFLRHAAFRI
jgi:hypothetical protein